MRNFRTDQRSKEPMNIGRKNQVYMWIAALVLMSAASNQILANEIMVSLSPDRSAAVLLDGQTVSGEIYVFFENTTPADLIDSVNFFVDGRPETTDKKWPYDLVGGDATFAKPWGGQLALPITSDNRHRLEANMVLADGTSQLFTAEFLVGSAQTAPTKALVISSATVDATARRLVLTGFNFDLLADKYGVPAVAMDLRRLVVQAVQPNVLSVALPVALVGDRMINIGLDGRIIPGLNDSLHAEILVTLGATELSCEGCVSENEVDFAYAAGDGVGGKALDAYHADLALSANIATVAEVAGNSDLLDGIDSSAFASVSALQALEASVTGVTNVLCQAIQRLAGNPTAEAIALCSDQLFKTVFTTSTLYNGDLKTAGGGATGVEGADNICNELARAAGLPGTYTAWLSDSFTDARDRVTQSGVPYRDVTGTIVADDFTDLTDCSNPLCLQGAIYRDEFGRDAGVWTTGSRTVWTNTATDGSKGVNSCNDWSSVGSVGTWGLIDQRSGPGWTAWNQAACTGEIHLYCFQD